jgi:hypothetical protein
LGTDKLNAESYVIWVKDNPAMTFSDPMEAKRQLDHLRSKGLDAVLKKETCTSKVVAESTQPSDVLDMIKKFLPIAVKELNLQSLPAMKPVSSLAHGEHPSFGRFVNETNTIEFAIEDRHPIDILRTLAHELVHCKQREDNRLKHDSGDTGSDEENEANARAGIIMRNFDDAYPGYFAEEPVTLAENAEADDNLDFMGGDYIPFLDGYVTMGIHSKNDRMMKFGISEIGLLTALVRLEKRYSRRITSFRVGTEFVVRTPDFAFAVIKDQEDGDICYFIKTVGERTLRSGVRQPVLILAEDTDYAQGNIDYHDTLNPVAWEGEHLRPEVRRKLLEIAKVFVDYLEIPNFEIADIVLTGSLANYNYTKFSDFDLHVVTDYSNLQCDDLAEALYQAKKQIWNDRHDITIHGYDVELYVEDINQPPVSAGTYSILDKKWINTPELKSPNIDRNAVNAKVTDLVKQIDHAIASADEPSDIRRVTAKLRKMRQSGLDAGGEFSVENLAFKVLRNTGYISKLSKAFYHKQDDQLSL